MPQHLNYGEGELLGWSNKTYKRRRERQRVAELNDALSRLKQLVPSVRELPFPNRGRGHDRLTKVGILRAAVCYIQNMMETLRTDVIMMDTLQTDVISDDTVLEERRACDVDLLSLSELCTDHGLEAAHQLVCEPGSPLPGQKRSADVIPSDWRVSSTTSN